MKIGPIILVIFVFGGLFAIINAFSEGKILKGLILSGGYVLLVKVAIDILRNKNNDS